MKTRTEFIIWVSLDEKVTEGDTERLVETAKEYAKFAGGKPELIAYLADDCLCLLIAATNEPMSVERDGKYLRTGIRKALEDAGMTDVLSLHRRSPAADAHQGDA